MKKVIAKHAAIPIFAGLITIGAVIYAEHHWPDTLPKTTRYAVLPYSIKFLDHLAVAFLSIGAIGIILEIPHLHNYFYGLFVDALTDPKYIQAMKKDNKEWGRRQQSKLMAGLFGKDEKTAELFAKDIEQPGSFFNYYCDQLQTLIGAPYRDQYEGITTVESSGDPKVFNVREEVSFRCCKVGEEIIDEIAWTAHQDELIRLPVFRVTITTADKTPTKIEWNETSPPPELTPGPEWGYTMSLKDYQGMDGLLVRLELEYVVPINRAFSANMGVITRGLKWTINYPANVQLFLDRFVLDDSINPKILTTQTQQYEYAHWLLPGDGFAFHFKIND